MGFLRLPRRTLRVFRFATGKGLMKGSVGVACKPPLRSLSGFSK
jgi:hypothetical protein